MNDSDTSIADISDANKWGSLLSQYEQTIIDNSQIVASTVASPNLDGEFELEGTECPEYSIMADDPTPTDTSTENSSMPSGQPLNGA